MDGQSDGETGMKWSWRNDEPSKSKSGHPACCI